MKTLILSLALFGACYAQTTATLTPTPKQQFLNATGQPLNGGYVYTYQAGTTTPLATYTDSTATVPNANPVVLDSAGRAAIWLGQHSYKVVLQDAAFNAIWTIDNVADSGVLAMQALSASAGSSRIGYSSGATGSVSRTVQSKLSDFANVMDFGGTCSAAGGQSDDHLAIQAAITYTQSAGGGKVYFPPHQCGTTVTIRLPSYVRFEGFDSTPSGIIAIGSFLTNTPLVCFGNTSCTDGTPVYGTSIEDMTLNCNGVSGSTGYQSSGAEEMTYLQWVNIYNCQTGMYLVAGYGNQNTRYTHVTIGAGAFANAIGVNANNLTGHSRFEDFTITGSNPSVPGSECAPLQAGSTCANSPAILLGGSAYVVVSGLHFEAFHTGVEIIGGNTNIVESVGGTTSNDIVGVYLCGGRTGGPLSYPCPSGSGATGATLHGIWTVAAHVVDDNSNVTVCVGPTCSAAANSTGNREVLYQYGGVGTWDSSGGGVLISSVPSAFQLFTGNITNSLTFASSAALKFFHENMGDMGNGAYFANVGSTNPQGLVIQSAFTPSICGASYPTGTSPCVGTVGGGGLFLNGNGVQGDAAFGSMVAGALNDGITTTATAPTAAGVVLNDGVGSLYANSGLTRGATFSTAPAIQWGPSGSVKLPAQHSTSGTRFLCVDTAGNVSASASACTGT